MSSWSERLRPRSKASRWPLVTVPMFVYVGVTVVGPAANGAARREGFWEHAVMVVALSAVMTASWSALGRASRRRSRMAAIEPGPPEPRA